MTEKVRLQRYLASAGVAARRKSEELIVAGRVRVNGKQVRLLGTKVDAERDHVTVDGEAVSPRDTFYVLLNKPKGCITAVEDDRGRPTVMEYLPNLPIPVKPVGRLDYYTEGVVLLTNDGDLASRLLSPQRHISRTYHVKIRGELRRDHLEALRTGVRLDDGTTTMPADVTLLPAESRHSWVAITTIDGRERQVQSMMEVLGYQVQKLQRVAFATLSFHGLRVGDARELTQMELNDLRDLVGLDHRAVARGVWRTYRENTDIPRRAREKLRAEAAEEAGEKAGDKAELAGARPAMDPELQRSSRPGPVGSDRTDGKQRQPDARGREDRSTREARSGPRADARGRDARNTRPRPPATVRDRQARPIRRDVPASKRSSVRTEPWRTKPTRTTSTETLDPRPARVRPEFSRASVERTSESARARPAPARARSANRADRRGPAADPPARTSAPARVRPAPARARSANRADRGGPAADPPARTGARPASGTDRRGAMKATSARPSQARPSARSASSRSAPARPTPGRPPRRK
jgi:23S rRNA pseudouridine2605 synthase